MDVVGLALPHSAPTRPGDDIFAKWGVVENVLRKKLI